MRRVTLAVLALLLIPSLAHANFARDEGLSFTAEEGTFRLDAGAILQPRYEYESRESDNTDHSSFTVQRARVNVSGHAYTEHLNYRILMDLAGGASLLDGWVEYRRFEPIRLRMGQFPVPFHRERDLPVGNLLGTERSPASREFQPPTGRDAGLMVSRGRSGGLEYRVGVFGGGGRNAPESGSGGMLWAGRATYVLLGNYARRESFHTPREGSSLSAGLGTYYAHENTARDWFTGLGFPAGTADTANVAAGTVDLQFRAGRWNLSGAFFHREVENHSAAGTRFDGNGYTLEAGYLLVPEVLFLTGRHARVYPNRDNPLTRARSYVVNLHLFQKENRSQTRFEVGVTRRRTAGGWDDDEFVRLQQQLAF